MRLHCCSTPCVNSSTIFYIARTRLSHGSMMRHLRRHGSQRSINRHPAGLFPFHFLFILCSHVAAVRGFGSTAQASWFSLVDIYSPSMYVSFFVTLVSTRSRVDDFSIQHKRLSCEGSRTSPSPTFFLFFFKLNIQGAGLARNFIVSLPSSPGQICELTTFFVEHSRLSDWDE